MNPEVARIAKMLEKTFDRHPWYGTSIVETLAGIQPEITTLRHGPTPTHSIVELILHMVSWRTFVTRRLQGDDTYVVSDEENFPAPGSWASAIERLKESQEQLLAAMKNFPDERLNDLVPHASHKYTYYTLLHGIIQHDIYHLGQIALMKKSWS